MLKNRVHLQYHKVLQWPMVNITRKQSWRSLSFDYESTDNMAQSPPISNPWKKISSNVSSDKNEALDLQEILHEESLQSANLSKAKSKPFSTTQLEEKAMA